MRRLTHAFDRGITNDRFCQCAAGEGRTRTGNRAYRQDFANVNLQTGDVIPQPLGTAAPAAPLVENAVRPSRPALEVADLPVVGWLVEVEAVAKYPSR